MIKKPPRPSGEAIVAALRGFLVSRHVARPLSDLSMFSLVAAGVARRTLLMSAS
jgi:hypothetical protein